MPQVGADQWREARWSTCVWLVAPPTAELHDLERKPLVTRIGLSPRAWRSASSFHMVRSALDLAVAALTDGGVRLTKRDIESLGVDSPASAPSTAPRLMAMALCMLWWLNS